MKHSRRALEPAHTLESPPHSATHLNVAVRDGHTNLHNQQQTSTHLTKSARVGSQAYIIRSAHAQRLRVRRDVVRVRARAAGARARRALAHAPARVDEADWGLVRVSEGQSWSASSLQTGKRRERGRKRRDQRDRRISATPPSKKVQTYDETEQVGAPIEASGIVLVDWELLELELM